MLKPWPSTSDGRKKLHLTLAWAWFAFGAYGLIDYLWIKLGIANSIPILFAISVYANFVGHLSSSEAANDTSD